MKKVYLLLSVLALLGVFFGCNGSVPTIPDVPYTPSQPDSPGYQPPAANTQRWAGDWEEEWPGASQSDSYRITVSSDGYTISVKPITRPERQNLSNLRWDGQTLSFTNYFDNRALYYELAIDASGNMLTGTVRLQSGQTKNIRWLRVGGSAPGPAPTAGSWPPPNQLSPSYNMSLADWLGDWSENWPGSSSHDIYRLQMMGNNQIMLTPQTNQEKQRVSNMNWTASRLTFVLEYGTQTWYYELVPTGPNMLNGMVTNQSSGEVKTITWQKSGGSQGQGMGYEAWVGVWEEYWPNQSAHDRYQIDITGNTITIQPLTRVGEQYFRDIRLSGNTLSFTLYYGRNMDQNPINYTMVMRDANTLDGEAHLQRTGKRIQVQWKKITGGGGGGQPYGQQYGAQNWSGTWEEVWPGRTQRDVYRISVYGNSLSIQPLTNTERQRVSNISFDGQTLNFVLFFGDNRIDYSLNMQNANTLTGTVRLSSGNTKSITWRRVQ
ncbi:MAG: hypothetical protein ACTSXZ_11165 [Alphaproteobacteria bacterium]